MGLPSNRDHTSIPIRYRVWSIEMSVYMCYWWCLFLLYPIDRQSDRKTDGQTDRQKDARIHNKNRSWKKYATIGHFIYIYVYGVCVRSYLVVSSLKRIAHCLMLLLAHGLGVVCAFGISVEPIVNLYFLAYITFR